MSRLDQSHCSRRARRHSCPTMRRANKGVQQAGDDEIGVVHLGAEDGDALQQLRRHHREDEAVVHLARQH